MGIFIESLIQMADGSTKPIGCVQLGDRVSCGDGRVASVRNVVRYSEQTQMANYHDFKLTPKHPVRCPSSEQSTYASCVGDKWLYVRELNTYTPYDEYSPLVNLELEEHHEIVGIHANGTIACLTMGHAGWLNPPVLFDLELEQSSEMGPHDYCDVCGDYDTKLWKFTCGCTDYCWECIPRKCEECSRESSTVDSL
jgi:hypothetical protein